MSNLFQCKTAFYAVLPACIEGNIIVDIGLAPATEYFFKLITPYNKVIADSFTTDAQGQGLIPVNLFAEGLLNPWMRLFQLEFYAALNNCNAINFAICDVVYNIVLFKIVEASGLQPIIGCQCEEV